MHKIQKITNIYSKTIYPTKLSDIPKILTFTNENSKARIFNFKCQITWF